MKKKREKIINYKKFIIYKNYNHKLKNYILV